jgi:hypothetical protein
MPLNLPLGIRGYWSFPCGRRLGDHITQPVLNVNNLHPAASPSASWQTNSGNKIMNTQNKQTVTKTKNKIPSAVAEPISRLPIPIWCSNQLVLIGERADIDRFKEQAVGHSPWKKLKPRGNAPANPLNFHNFVPIPKEVLTAKSADIGPDWEMENWGAKMGACRTKRAEIGGERETGFLIYQFYTADAPPLAFIKSVSKKWPTMTFLLDFRGCVKATDGDLTEDFG